MSSAKFLVLRNTLTFVWIFQKAVAQKQILQTVGGGKKPPLHADTIYYTSSKMFPPPLPLRKPATSIPGCLPTLLSIAFPIAFFYWFF